MISTSFTHSLEGGDIKGSPDRLMELWFDLHLYLANVGSRGLMIWLAKRLDRFPREVDCAKLRGTSGAARGVVGRAAQFKAVAS